MALPLLLIGVAAAVAVVGVGGAAAVAVAREEEEERSKEAARKAAEKTARNRREAAEQAARREEANRKSRQRNGIREGARREFARLARDYPSIGRSPGTQVTFKTLRQTVSHWGGGRGASFRAAKDTLMPMTNSSALDRERDQIRALSGQIGALADLSDGIAKHTRLLGSGRRDENREKRIRAIVRQLANQPSGGAESLRADVDKYLEFAAMDVDAPTRIAACGLLCAGKSSLLNALAGRHAPDYFPTGGGRTTRDCKRLEVQFGEHPCVLVDTPGLDAGNLGEDDDEATEEIGRADHLLFVHPLATGELHAKEVEFLSGHAAAGETAPYLTVVLTHAESHGDVAERLSASILSMVREYAGRDAEGFLTSAPTHRRGALENKPLLVEASGIPSLQVDLASAAAAKRAATLDHRRKHLESLRAKVEKCIDRQSQDCRSGRDKAVNERKERQKSFDDDFASILRGISHRVAAV